MTEEQTTYTATKDQPETEPYLSATFVMLRYTGYMQSLDAFKEKHKAILEEYEEILAGLAGAEKDLKEYARDNGDLEDDVFSVTVQKKSRRSYDAESLLDAAPWLLQAGALVVTADKAKVEALAKGDMLPSDVVEAAKREEELTPAVSIRRKEAKE